MVSQGTASRIIVMGATGSGKSTFINLLSGSTLSVSDGLKSCTSEVLESRQFVLDDQDVILVDTPGFDDTTRSDTDIISAVSTYLADMYRQGVRLSGVIYMHRISDVRIGGTSLLNFRIFHELCGNESLHNALVVTTMWSAVDPKLGESREQELATAEDLFKPVLDNGARLVRHDGTLKSAQSILRRFNTRKGTTLRIQRELVDEGKALIDTFAGAELARLFVEQAGRLEARGRKLQEQMEEASLAEDLEGWIMIQSEFDKMQKERKRVQNESERLHSMMPSIIDSDVVRLVSTELAGRLGEGSYAHGNVFRAREQARMQLQKLLTLNESEKGRKRTRKEDERLQNEVDAVSKAMEHLQSWNMELYDDLRAASRDRQDWTEPRGKRVEQALEEVKAMKQQFEVVVESQNKLVAEVTKLHQERECGRSIRERMSGWYKIAVDVLVGSTDIHPGDQRCGTGTATSPTPPVGCSSTVSHSRTRTVTETNDDSAARAFTWF